MAWRKEGMAKTPFFAFALVLAAVLLIAPGCALKDQEDHAIAIDDRFTAKPLVVPKYLADRKDLLCKELDDAKPCYCFTCKNNTGLTMKLLMDSYDNTLVGGACNATYCNQDDYIDYVNNFNDIEMRTFMLGSGQSFVSGGAAGLYCNYTLQLATKWMKGSEGKPPVIPLASRAYCWLGRGMLPLFIYYTGGTEINVARTAEMAQAFNAADAGPAIITTEAGWNGTDNDAVGKVKAQIEALQTCKKCIKVLAVKPSDYTALYSILGVPGNIDAAMLSKVDAIGFGFRTNDYPHCDMNQIIYENINFSSYILQKYNKPTIWLYVGASEGNSSIGGDDAPGGCVWDAAKVSNFYTELMSQSGRMANAGVLGMSLYEFVDRSGPIPCNGVQGCDFGMLDVNGSQKHPELNTWSKMCQRVNVDSGPRTPLFFSRNGQGGTLCGNNVQNTEAGMGGVASIGTARGLEMGTVASTPKIPNMGCGEVCVSNATMKKPEIYDSTGEGFHDKRHCSMYPLIDEFADNADVSATYMRAIIEQESGFDQYAVSNISNSSTGCNNERYAIEKICEYAGVAPENCPSFSKGGKPCAYGIAQCIEYPGQYYVENGLALPDAIKDCGGEKYNPFDPGMSACCGAKKFGDNLRNYDGMTAEKWVNNNWAELSKCQPGGMTEDEKGWAAYYIASNMYNGARWNMLFPFTTQRDADGDCTGTLHYIAYLRSQASGDPPSTNYGAQVMSRYKAAAALCKSECPS